MIISVHSYIKLHYKYIFNESWLIRMLANQLMNELNKGSFKLNKPNSNKPKLGSIQPEIK